MLVSKQVVIGCLGILWGSLSIAVGALGLGIYNEMSATELAIRMLNINTAFGVVRILLAFLSIATGAAGLKAARLRPHSVDDEGASARASEAFHKMYLALSIATAVALLAGSVQTTMWIELLHLEADNMFRILALGGKWLASITHSVLRGYFWYVIWSFKVTMGGGAQLLPDEELMPQATVISDQT